MDEDESTEFDYPEDYEFAEDEEKGLDSYDRVVQSNIPQSVYAIQSLGTTIEGKGVLQNTMWRQVLSPEDAFSAELHIIFKKVGNLDDVDKVTIFKEAGKLPMIKYKNALAFVLGYLHVKKDVPFQNFSVLIQRDNQVTNWEIAKYAKYWSSLLFSQT